MHHRHDTPHDHPLSDPRGGRSRRGRLHAHRGGRHGGGPGSRHRARRGAIAAAILELLDERPMHGYELISELDERSGGRWRPSPGSIYPALGRLEEHGLIVGDEADDKRVYRLTDAGRQRLAERRDVDDAPPWERSGHGRRGDLRRSIAELVGPARQIGRFGTTEQVEQARAAIDGATRRLYEILAAGRGETTASESPDVADDESPDVADDESPDVADDESPDVADDESPDVADDDTDVSDDSGGPTAS